MTTHWTLWWRTVRPLALQWQRGLIVGRQHFLALDGLRGVAALAVVIYHRRWFGPDGHAFDHGFLAVNFFFILSGFVIDYAYRERLANRMSLGEFTKQRFIRLYPLIAAGGVLGLIYACLLARMNHESGAYFNYVLAAGFNVFGLPAPPNLVTMPFYINRPTWSLFFELVANLGYALLLFKLGTRALLVLGAVLLPSLIYVAHTHGTLNVGFEYKDMGWGLSVVFVPFIIGVVLNRVRDRIEVPALPFWASAGILILLFQPNQFSDGWEKVYQLSLMLVGFPLLILASLRSQPSGHWASVASFSGAISYPLYVLHYPILQLISGAAKIVGFPDFPTLIAITLASVAAAWIAARYYDEPVRNWLKGKMSSRPQRRARRQPYASYHEPSGEP